ncbi:MAG: DUF2927 domain-containing protein [Paracoccaceae bacterium]|nr:MAG: DUF2927 domain-containing protein [Paracoccaceae bacterium]
MRARGFVALMLALVLGAVPPAWAETLVRLDQQVSDTDFHRAVACAASPGGKCRDPWVAWGRRTRMDLRVALMPPDPGYPAAIGRIVETSVDAAIAEINGTGAGLRLRRVAPGERPHIRIMRSRLREGERTRDVPGFPDGIAIGVGQFQIWWNGDRVLERAAILISSDIRAGEVRSVVLEEIVQSLGLWHDVEGAGYSELSIFDDNSNGVTWLRGQDRAILRLHYPPR